MGYLPVKFQIVNQTSTNTCMCACLAMILEEDLNEIVAAYHDLYYPKMYMTPGDFLLQNGVPSYEVPVTAGTLWGGQVYLLRVPSLNVQGASHAIIADCRSDTPTIFDPNEGRNNQLFYTMSKESISNDRGNTTDISKAVLLNSWIIELVLVP